MQPNHAEITTVNQQHMSDEELIELIRLESPQSFQALSTLLQRYENELLRRCYFKLGNSDDAKDAVQETLIRVYRAILGFEGKSSFRTWLYTISDNQVYTLATRRMRHLLNENIIELIKTHESLTRFQNEFDGADRVHLTLNAMPSKTRRLLKMRYFMGLSLTEIAHNLGIGLSATKMRLYRAHDTFKEYYLDTTAAHS